MLWGLIKCGHDTVVKLMLHLSYIADGSQRNDFGQFQF